MYNRDFSAALDRWLTTPPDEDYPDEDTLDSAGNPLPEPFEHTRRDGRKEDRCSCSAYRFPHRSGSGKCTNRRYTERKRPLHRKSILDIVARPANPQEEPAPHDSDLWELFD